MIELLCPSCGTRLRVADDKAGHKGQCPKCRNPLLIPRVSPGTTGSQIAPVGSGRGLTCPKCRRTYQAGVQLCTSCGVNLQTGRSLTTAVVARRTGRRRMALLAGGVLAVVLCVCLALFFWLDIGGSRPIAAGPYKFEVLSAQVTKERSHTIQVPGGRRTLTADGKDEVIVLITVELTRLRGYTAAERSAMQSDRYGKVYQTSMDFFEADMVVSNDMFNLIWPREDKVTGQTKAHICQCLMEGRFYAGALSIAPVKANAQKIRHTLAFTFNPKKDYAILSFTPVPGGAECKAAALAFSGNELSSVRYGDSKEICKKYLPKALFE